MIKIPSNKQLEFIKHQYPSLVRDRVKEYNYEGRDPEIFENLILFTDNEFFETLRKDHYLSMPECQRLWNEYFWYLRYKTDIKLSGGNISNHEQPIFKVLERLYNNCEKIDDSWIEPFVDFTEDFSNQEYIIFDYFHPAVTDIGISLKSDELKSIVEILNIVNFSIDEVDDLIEKNIDDPNGELLIYSSQLDDETKLKIDTFTAGEDQIHPVHLLIKCPMKFYNSIDELLVRWWKRFWNRMGPFVAISILDKFETEDYFRNRIRINK